MSNILVLGAYGLLGESLCAFLAQSDHVVRRQGRRSTAEVCINPFDSDAIASSMSELNSEVIINLIAHTNVDDCERNPQSAYRANTGIVNAIARAVEKQGVAQATHLIHVSTDQVYDGIGPHQEHTVDPCNVYGLSKLAGELVATQIGATILRTNFYGRSKCAGRVSLTDWIVNSLRSKTKIVVFEDVFFSALHIQTLCRAIELAVRIRHPGTFNVGCLGGGSKADLAFGLAQRLNLDQALMTIGYAKNSNSAARRPLDMRLDSSRFQQSFGFEAPTFELQIDLTAKEYLDEHTES